MNTTEIFAAVREHGSTIRVWNLRLQVRGFDTLPPWLQHEIREHRYELIKALGTAGCRTATPEDIADLWRWLEDGTLERVGRRGLVIIPGWELNEVALVRTFGLFLQWYAVGTATNTAFLELAGLIADRVRAMLDEGDQAI